jgi:hypothetical protein
VPPRQQPSKPVTVERRLVAFTPPPCHFCGSVKTAVARRMAYVLEVRCAHCASVWFLPKPGHRPFSE